MSIRLPDDFIAQIENIPNCNPQQLLDGLFGEKPTSFRVNPNKIKTSFHLEQVKWTNQGYYLQKKPLFTLDPLLHAGAYYVQEASSMFVGHAFKQLFQNPKNLRILDCCAAPGGKSTHLASQLDSSSLLIANEFVSKRASILSENLQKWGFSSTIVTNSDTRNFSILHNYFDAIVVDAPCSGEGMFRKDDAAILEWSLENIAMCAKRQKQILQDIWPCLKQGGYLLYSTCTFNVVENEEIAQWIIDEMGGKGIAIPIEKEWGIQEILMRDVISYRCYPGYCKGEGFSLMVLQKQDKFDFSLPKIRNEKKFMTPILKNESPELQRQITNPDYAFYENPFGDVFAFSQILQKEIALISQSVKIYSAGSPIAKRIGKSFIPNTTFALSDICNVSAFETFEIDKTTALKFLSKTAFNLPNVQNGWVLLTFKNIPLGIVKNLGNRVNNSYPMEWRIRMNVGTIDGWEVTNENIPI